MECGIDGFFFSYVVTNILQQNKSQILWTILLSYEYSDNDNQLKNGGIHNETEKWANNMKCEKEEEIWFVVTTLQQPANHSICLWLHHYYIYIYIYMHSESWLKRVTLTTMRPKGKRETLVTALYVCLCSVTMQR